jgi:riboflavin biosynthesis pyrimidine reductase
VTSIRELTPRAGMKVDPLSSIGTERRGRPVDRPWVLTNMIATLDGATAVDGLSGELGGPADLAVFMALRSVPDIIIVGAATAIAEEYKAPSTHPTTAAARASRNQSHRPTVVVVTRSLSLEPSLPLFDDPTYRPIILTVDDAPAERVDALSPFADIVTAGSGGVDLLLGLRKLLDLGHEVALLEGGPSLNGQFVAKGLIDEWNMSLSPILAGGSSKRPAQGPPAPDWDRWTLARLWQGDDLLFGRWLRDGTQPEQ